MQNIDDFVTKLLAEKGIEGASGEERDALKEQILDRIDQDAIKKLSDEQLKKLASLIDDPSFDGAKMDEYLKNCGIDIDEVAADSAATFRSEYLGGHDE